MFSQARFNSNIVVDVGNKSGSPAYASMSFDATQVELYRLLNLLVMVTLMDSEKIVYRCLPSTPELLELLTLPKTITRLDQWIRLLMGVIIGAALLTGVLLGAIAFRSGMKRLHRLAWLLKRSADLRHTLLLGRRQRGKKP